jgi:hypothetical protein
MFLNIVNNFLTMVKSCEFVNNFLTMVKSCEFVNQLPDHG